MDSAFSLRHLTACVFFIASFFTNTGDAEETQAQSIHHSATVGPFFRIQLMFHPRFRDGFESETMVQGLRQSVSDRLDIKNNERLNDLLKSAGESPNEDDAKRFAKAFQEEFGKVAEEVELELKSGYDPSKLQEVAQTQLAMLGLRGLVDPKLASLLELEDDQQASIQKIIRDKPLASFKSKVEAEENEKRQARLARLGKLVFGASPDEAARNPERTLKPSQGEGTQDTEERPTTTETMLPTLEIKRRKRIEYDEWLHPKVMPILSDAQKLRYQEILDRATERNITYSKDSLQQLAHGNLDR